MELPFIPGLHPSSSGPLARFLPPLPEGVAGRIVADHTSPGDLVLDAFGASPRVALEAALCGRAVLVTAHNPVARFLLQMTARAPEPSALRGMLARLADLPKDGQRLEGHLRSLYQSRCGECDAAVEVDAFVWSRDEAAPVLKHYYCHSCGRSHELPADDDDRRLAGAYQRRGLQHALALERVAARGDPDRVHAEEALEAYPPRAVYALMSLLTKLDALDLRPADRALAEALLLAAFDSGDGLRGHPESRPRPRQLSLPARYIELNLWRAVERAPDAWSADYPAVPIMVWTGTEPIPPGTIGLFEGPMREVASRLNAPLAPRVALTLSVLPRPNQAYWTLSALWTGWLWGQEAVAPFKGVLRRRRYDWGWHAEALEAAAHALASAHPDDAPVIGLMPEAEPGFVAAAMAGFDLGGFVLSSMVLRADSDEAQFHWKRRTHAAARPSAIAAQADLRAIASRAAKETLETRGEPSPWPILHAAVWSAILRRMPAGSIHVPAESNLLTHMGDQIEAAMAEGQGFVRFGVGGRASAPETGLWWLEAAPEMPERSPLSDRVEAEVLNRLSTTDTISEVDMDLAVCREFPGRLTPGERLVRECLRSYGTNNPYERWRLREEDRTEVRDQERESIRAALADLGVRLGYQVSSGAPVEWHDAGEVVSRFFVLTSASIGQILLDDAWDPTTSFIVLPGGRASLVEFRLKRDPRLRSAVDLGWRFLKFRHVRSLAADPRLTRAAYLERLPLDPLGKSEAQLTLL